MLINNIILEDPLILSSIPRVAAIIQGLRTKHSTPLKCSFPQRRAGRRSWQVLWKAQGWSICSCVDFPVLPLTTGRDAYEVCTLLIFSQPGRGPCDGPVPSLRSSQGWLQMPAAETRFFHSWSVFSLFLCVPIYIKMCLDDISSW